MDNIREWISDNLRYILLGLALILVLAVAILGIRAIGNIASGGSDTKKQETETETQAQTEDSSDVIVDTDGNATVSAGALVENDAKVLTTMTSYYSARTNGDTETLQKLDPSMTEEDQANLTNNYVESYSNIKTYSKEGPTSGNYVVYVCYDGKVKDIDTLVPSLTKYYLKSNEDGSLYIADATGDTAAQSFMDEVGQSTEVQDLIADVSAQCAQAEDSDPALKEFMQKYGNSQSTSDDSDTSKEASEMVAIDECNVRTEPNTDCDVLASLSIGETVTVIEQRDDGWTEIDYDGQTAYVSSEFLSTAEDADAASEAAESEAMADSFAPAAASDDTTADDATTDDGTVA